MILQALYALAQREQLMDDPDYEVKPVAWLITVGDGGQFGGLLSTRTPEALPEGSKKKPKMLAKPMLVPREASRTSGDCALFLVDKSEYLFGVAPGIERAPEKLANRTALYRARVAECLAATDDTGVRAIHDFLAQVVAGKITVALPAECAGNDLFAFIYAPDIDVPVHLGERVRTYWQEQRAQVLGEPAALTTCLVTGRPCIPVDTVPLLKKVPGGSTSGVALISFNANAFESYGLSGAANAPLSREAAEATMTALNRLIHPAFPDPRDPNRTLARRHTKLSADTLACYWTREAVGDPMLNVLGAALAGDSEALVAAADDMRVMFDSLWKGTRVVVPTPSAFYSLVLTGGQGRATLRDWLECTTQNVVDHLADYYAGLAMVRRNAPGKGKPYPRSYPLGELLEAIADPERNRQEGVPGHLAAALYHAAVMGGALPQAILQRAVARYRVEVGYEQRDGLDGWNARRWNDARAALIKLALNRFRRQNARTHAYEEITPAMNPHNRQPGYLLGQLLAVLERLQAEALGDVNATLVDRYFSGASAAPASVFFTLLKNARHHARKAKDDAARYGAVLRLEQLIDQLTDQFLIPNTANGDPLSQASANGFPRSLNLDEQGLFVLGYHQMRKWLWMMREERQEWEAANATAPRAYRWTPKGADAAPVAAPATA